MPSAPTPPDPYATAAAQTQANKDAIAASAKFNQVTQNNPYGSQQWSGSYGQDLTDEQKAAYKAAGKTDDEIAAMQNGDRTVTTSFSPDEQAKYDLENRAIMGAGSHVENRLGQITDTPFSLSGMPDRQYGGLATDYTGGPATTFSLGDAGPIQGSVANAGGIQTSVAGAGPVQRTLGNSGQIQTSVGGADAATRNSVEDALYNRSTARLDPRFATSDREMETKLANQGITQGSDAYTRAMSDYGQTKNDAYSSAANDAITGGGAEQSRLFGLGVQQGDFANNAQAQQFGQDLSRGNFYNTGQAQQFGQGVTQGQFANSAQAQQYGQNAQDMSLGNAAQAQLFGQNAAGAQFANDSAALQDQRGQNATAFSNNAIQQNQNSTNANRDAMINELLLTRQQPLNEISQLLTGAQAQAPQFGGVTQYQQAAAPIGDYINQNYQSQLKNSSGLMGGLFGLGGSLGSAAILACWVAREVYGTTNPRWFKMRDWMLHKAPERLREFYLKHGPMIAEFIRDKPEWKLRIHSAMEECLV